MHVWEPPPPSISGRGRSKAAFDQPPYVIVCLRPWLPQQISSWSWYASLAADNSRSSKQRAAGDKHVSGAGAHPSPSGTT